MSEVIPIVKGGQVLSTRGVRPINRFGTTLREGEYRKVDATTADNVRFSPYGDWYPKSAFVGVTATARLEANVAAKKALVVKAQAAVVVAEKALADALNPPVKVGDTVRCKTGHTDYKLIFDDGEAVVLGIDKKRYVGTRAANASWFPLVRVSGK